MSVFTKEDDWFEGALRVEMPARPVRIANQWSEDDPTEEPDVDEDGVEIPLDDDQTEEDPFGDFDDDDFDDEFDDDFEEDWEDDLTEDDEFPDTFGGAEPEEKVVEAEEDEDSPFADDPDFDEA